METGEKQKGRIITALCETCKALGKKYTVRLLPNFLIPYAVIRSDSVLNAIEKDSEKHDLEKVCLILGCIDFRTARKYLKMGMHAVKNASLALSERLSFISSSHITPGFYPDTPALSYFTSLVRDFNNLQVSIHGGFGYEIQCLPYHFIGLNWQKSQSHKPTTFVSAPEDSPDKT